MFALPPLLLLAAWVALPRINLGGIAAQRLTGMAGRGVTIEALHLVPGNPWRLVLRGAGVANIAGGSEPLMLRVDALEAGFSPIALLGGRVVLHDVAAQGVRLLLEKVEGRRNWRFIGDPTAPADPLPAPPDRSGLPTPLRITLADTTIAVRTSSGQLLETRLDRAAATAEADDAPLELRIDAAFQGVPLRGEGRLGTPRAWRDGPTPLPMAFTITAPETRLTFGGLSGDPLNFDRLDGRLGLAAEHPRALARLAGADDAPPIGFEVTGAFTHAGPLWRLAEAEGFLDGAAMRLALLEYVEGSPDAVAIEGQLAHLALERFSGGDGGGNAFDALATPDPTLRLALSLDQVGHGPHQARAVRLRATLAEQGLVLEEATGSLHGSRLTVRAHARAVTGGARLTGSATALGGTLDGWRRALGMRALPFGGNLEAHAEFDATGANPDQAFDRANLQAVLSLNRGSIAREVVEAASIDVRALFRTARGYTPLRCALAVVALRGGRGEVAPLRLRAETGSISGLGSIDLNRGTLDVVIGSQRDSTGFFALDIPVRLSGSLRDPDVAPAAWSAEGRARLASGDLVARLPPYLRDQAMQNRCYR